MLPPNLVQLMRVEQLFQNIHMGRLSETRRLFKDIDHHDAVVLLESRNADLRMQTPLLACIQRGHVNIMRFLLSEGADPNVVDGLGVTTLQAAFGHEDCIDDLIKYNALDINVVSTEFGYSALMYGCLVGSTKLVKKLLKCPGVMVNTENEKHYTALHLSCGVGAVEIVGALLAHPGVSINAQDEEGRTALMIAVDQGHLAVVHVLLQHREIDGNLHSLDGRTALRRAYDNNDMGMAQILLNSGKVDDENGMFIDSKGEEVSR
eukprot:gene3978-4352_t